MKNVNMLSACMAVLIAAPCVSLAQTVINQTTGSSYSTVNAAVNAVQDGQTIVISADQTLTSNISLGTSKDGVVFTLQGSGSGVTIAAANNARAITSYIEGNTIYLQNLTLQGTGTYTSSGAAIGFSAPTGDDKSTEILGSYAIKGFSTTGNGAGVNSTTSGGTIVLGSVGGLVEFSNNTSSGQGGAIRAQDLVFNANAILSNNKTTSNSGGAIYAAGNITFSGSATITGNRDESANNGSGHYGGAIHMNTAGTKLWFMDNATLESNATVNGNGGAGRVYFLVADKDLFVASNTANRNVVTSAHGGAFYVQADMSVAGVTTATGNYAASSGGAFYLQGSGTFNGGSTFTNNTAATGNGGAVYWGAAASGNLAFNADSADILFDGNIANGNANALFISQNSSSAITHTLVLNTGTGNTIAFHDPVASTSNASSASILVDISGSGIVLFDTYKSNITADTTVAAGATLRLANGAIYGASNSTGAFTLKNGATLSGNGAISAGAIAIEAGTLLEVADSGTLLLDSSAPSIAGGLRLAGHGTIDAGQALSAAQINVGVLTGTAPNSAQTLSFASSTPLTLETGGTISFDLFGGASSDQLTADSLSFGGGNIINLLGLSGTYTLLTTANSTFTTSDFTLYVNGLAPTARYGVTPTVNSAGSGSELVVDFSTKNLAVNWTGAADGTWKASTASDANWTDNAATPENFFQNGDRVLFDDSAAGKSVGIDAAGVQVADMTVNTSGTYTFAGAGGITAGTAYTIASSTFTPTGKLVKSGGGELAFANAAANQFAGGIDIDGGVISFTRADQIGTSGTSVSFAAAASGTLRPAVSGIEFSNTIDIGAGATAAVEVRSGSATYRGTLNAATGADVFAKTGAGLLVLDADNAAFAGSTRIAAGSLLLASGAQLGGAVTVLNGATLGGRGVAGTGAGGVTVQSGGIIEIGLPGTPGAQTLTLNNLSLDGAVLKYDLFGTTGGDGFQESDRIALTGAPLVLGGGDSTILIESFQTGTFNLGNLAALDGHASVAIAGGGGSRQSVVLSSTNSDLILTAGADMSRVLRWTGSTSAEWDGSTVNWTDSGSVNEFASGDRVIFDGVADAANPGNRILSINGGVMRVSDLWMQGAADYEFTGSHGIEASAANVIHVGGSSAVDDPAGKLVKDGAGTLTFSNSAANNFAGGVEVRAGTIVFARADHLGDGGNGIHFTGSGTLRLSAEPGAALPNNLVVDDAQTAALDTNGHSLVLGGTLASGGTGATLAKLGADALTLTADSSGFAGKFDVLSGTVALASNARLGGAVSIASGAAFGGAGFADGAVTAASGARVEVGGPAAGTLTVADLRLNSGAVIAGSGTLAGRTVIGADAPGVVTADIATAAQLFLTGTLTGSGTLAKTGAGDLVYANAAALGHTATEIREGYVMLRGIDGLAAASGTHVVALAGGWLDLSETSFDTSGSSAHDWSGLVLTGSQGGVIGGNDRITLRAGETAFDIGSATKQGVFVVIAAGAGGTAALSGSNTYMGYTRIDSGALEVSADAQLGDTTAHREVVLNGGSLRVTGSGFTTARALELRAAGEVFVADSATTAWAAINKNAASSVAFTKTGSGALVIAGANTADTTSVAAGRLVARQAAGAGAGAVTVADGAAFVFENVPAGTVANRFTGAGSLEITGGALTLSGASDIARISVTGGASVTASSAGGLGGASTSVRIDAARALLGATNTTLGAVELANGGTLGFAPSATSFKRAALGSLSGGGVLALNTNLGLSLGDQFAVASAPSGGYTLVVTNTGAAPAALGAPVDLLVAPSGGGATFELEGGHIDAGMYAYTLNVADGDGQVLVSLGGSGALSNAGGIITGMSGAMPLSWFAELDTVHKRMGELRALPAEKGRWQTWLRGYGQRLDVESKATGVAFSERQIGGDVGLDCNVGNIDGTGAAVYIGGFMGYGQAERDFDSAGDGRSESMYGGVYGTVVTGNGWYLDGVLKYNGFKNRFNATATTREFISARYNTYAIGGSLEAGKKIDFGKGWFFEPQIQGAFTMLSGKEYSASNGMEVELRWGTTGQGRVGFLFGRGFTSGFGEFFQPYVKLYGASQWTTDGQVIVGGDRFNPTLKGDRIEGGCGLMWMPGRRTQLYIDYELASADYYDKPWGFNFGFRHMW
ncbi:autotransporter outer membrane beta-barrel domain-containing protein [Termitidicoccus mucosus]|uniref:autotransporter outer membrane beta-barrel domain-containing protein n=1 Tax=Termitidicoccus mucosus TaxID=1184151 RepID=UPI0031843BFF